MNSSSTMDISHKDIFNDSSSHSLPSSSSPSLVLGHPTLEERNDIWKDVSVAWMDSLTAPLFLKESLILTTVPLARDGGMTTWVLVEKYLPLGRRRILCSCESFRKHSLTSDAAGIISDNIVHGIASVFCPVTYRGRGYAGRMMKELSKKLYNWQTETMGCVGSTLYSDIGREYYTRLGWSPNITNSHVEIQPQGCAWPTTVRAIQESDLADLCRRDEAFVRAQMGFPTDEAETRFTILPDLDHMHWHIAKENFATDHLFGKTPTCKGAIIGMPGSQVWAIWVRRYYGRPDDPTKHNVLYILRLAVELDETATRLSSHATRRPAQDVFEQQSSYLKAVIQAAKSEAAEWKLGTVKIWDPTPLVSDLLVHCGLEYKSMEREDDSIASLLWYDREGGEDPTSPLWVNNEHYAWQ